MRPTNRDTPPAGHFNAAAVADRRDSRAGRPQLARPDLADSKPPQQHHLPPDRTLRSAPRCWLSQHRRPPSNRSLAPQRPGRVTKRRRDAPQRPRVTAHSFAVPFFVSSAGDHLYSRAFRRICASLENRYGPSVQRGSNPPSRFYLQWVATYVSSESRHRSRRWALGRHVWPGGQFPAHFGARRQPDAVEFLIVAVLADPARHLAPASIRGRSAAVCAIAPPSSKLRRTAILSPATRVATSALRSSSPCHSSSRLAKIAWGTQAISAR